MNVIERPPTNGHSTRLENVLVPPRRKVRRPWIAAVAAVLVLAIVATTIVLVRSRSNATVTYETAAVVRQDLVQAVTATGTVNPQNTIAVGTQVSGTLAELDVDYNSKVHKGQILAKLDPTTFQADLDQSKAQLAQAQAQEQSAQATAAGAQSGIGNANATQRAAAATAQAAAATARANQAAVATAASNVTKAQSALSLAQQTVTRDRSLLGQGYISQSQLDTDSSGLVAAQSAVASAQAANQQAIQQASASASQAIASSAQTSAQSYAASTAQSQAATQSANAQAGSAAVAGAAAQVRSAQLNLERTVITSPVDGTVVARSVSVGQTVAASFQTPTLFSIAQDLNKMEVDLSVGEPDIGNVRNGDGVDFTVLAFPSRTFHGVVSQVRINPTTVSNVVTYTTVVLVDNRDGVLLPGMTANASIHVAKASNALVVPVAALAYRPASGNNAGGRRRRGGRSAGTAAGAGGAGSANGSATGSGAGASPWGATNGDSAPLVAAGSRGRIYVQRAGKVVRIPVQISLVTGTQAAVEPAGDAALTTSDTVIVGDSRPGAPAGGSGSASRSRGPGGAGGVMRALH